MPENRIQVIWIYVLIIWPNNVDVVWIIIDLLSIYQEDYIDAFVKCTEFRINLLENYRTLIKSNVIPWSNGAIWGSFQWML